MCKITTIRVRYGDNCYDDDGDDNDDDGDDDDNVDDHVDGDDQMMMTIVTCKSLC